MKRSEEITAITRKIEHNEKLKGFIEEKARKEIHQINMKIMILNRELDEIRSGRQKDEES